MGGRRDVTRDILVESMSEDHVKVIEKLDQPRYAEDIASELNVKATIVRTLLNDLHENRLVEYERSKNKRTGWYTYLWRKRDDKIEEYIRSYLENKLSKLNEQLEKEKNNIGFNCSCSTVEFEVAMDSNFICPDCNGKYVPYDNSEVVDRLVGEISEINSLINKT